MAIGRISGRMLKDNLDRDDSLTFNTNTLAIDYANSQVGIGTASPESSLQVIGDTKLANIQISNLTISSITGNASIVISPNGTGNVSVDSSYINNVNDPIQAQDAATKAYVDLATSSLNPLGNLSVSDTTITTVTSADDIILDAEDGVVVIAGTSGFEVPVGNTSQRPATVNEGTVRWNSEDSVLEVYDGTIWGTVGKASVIADEFNGDGSTISFTLSEDATTENVIVTLNGVVQLPTTTYTVSGNVITFTDAPETGDKIDIRLLQTLAGTSSSNATFTNLTVTGDIKSNSFYFVKRSTNTSISYPGSYSAVTIDYEDAGDDYNSTDAMWSSSTDRFTPTVAGLWYIRASVDCYSGATQEGGMFIEKNGSSVAAVGHIGAIRPQITTHLYMNGSTDYIQFKAYTQSSTTRGQSAANSFFEALLVKQAE